MWLSLAAAAVLVAITAAIFFFLLRGSNDGLQDAEAYYARGTQYLTSGDCERAIADFDQAIALGPSAESYYNRGVAYYSKNDADSADWNDAISLNPRDARAYRQRGNAYSTKGDYNLALADYNRAIELEPNDAKAYYNRALVFKARGETAKAAADFRAVLTLANDPDAGRDAQAQLSGLENAASPLRTVAESSREGAAQVIARQASVGLASEWSAQVTYGWGDKYTEHFSFKLDGNDVVGTASFLGVRRGIRDGTLSGDSLLFTTTTQETSGDGNNVKDVIHRYRGRISGEVITFFMQSEGGSSTLPVEFTARREP